MTAFYLGIDGGGSKTIAALCQCDAAGQRTITTGTSGPSNLVTLAADVALKNIEQAILAAFDRAGIARRTVDVACLALAGSGRSEIRRTLDVWARGQSLAQRIHLVHDAQPLLAWTPADEPAVALISGTGSMAWGRSPQGQIARAGGWGPLLGDVGSGYWFGLQATKHVLAQFDQAAPMDSVSRRVLDHFACPDPADLPRLVQPSMRDRIAQLAPHVLALASHHAIARQWIEEAAQHLAESVATVARRLIFHAHAYSLVCAGGLLVNSNDLRQLVLAQLASIGWEPSQTKIVEQPVLGALELACQAGIEPVKERRP